MNLWETGDICGQQGTSATTGDIRCGRRHLRKAGDGTRWEDEQTEDQLSAVVTVERKPEGKL